MQHIAALRLSLLMSLGLVPAACGGSSTRQGDEPKPSVGGAPTSAGSPAIAGNSAGAGNSAVAGVGGNPVVAGSPAVGGGLSTTLPTCSSPKLDPVSGLVTCAEGYVHRQTIIACEISVGAAGEDSARGAALPRAPQAPDPLVACVGEPGDCQQFALGYCSTEGQITVCRSGCTSDAECGADQICICAEASPTGGVCHPSTCRSDADCGPSSYCANYHRICEGDGFDCVRAKDECVGSADCGSARCIGGGVDGKRSCISADCGRPFLVEAETRVAPLVMHGAWSSLEHAAPSVAGLTRAERARLAAHWSRLGQLEHASIAAFARFSLQLLALGAPPELVEGCTRALADETAHAQLCFRLASAYAERELGPGALDISGRLLTSSLAEIVELVIVEGCFGETGAALEALEAAEAASDPVIAAVYARIAGDEQRHAELAFRFVRWALERDAGTVMSCIARAVATPAAQSAAALGVTLPCLQALLATARPALVAQIQLQ